MTGYRQPIAIFGPTASGKTQLAILLAQHFDGVVINADSLQVYQDLPTLTARPDADEVAQADHRLFGFLSATEKMDAARWMTQAARVENEVKAAGRLPIFCGGTGFYLKALEEGLSAVPAVAAESDKAAETRLAGLGIEGFEAEVFANDPQISGTFETGDRQRLLRAWSVWHSTGKPLSYWQSLPKRGGIGRLESFALMPDRTALYSRINQRFSAMMQGGAVQEVEALAATNPDPQSLPIAQAIGFDEICGVLEGRYSEAEAVAKASQATRNYAKRQLTWVRNQALNAIKLPYLAINEQEIRNISEIIISFICQRA